MIAQAPEHEERAGPGGGLGVHRGGVSHLPPSETASQHVRVPTAQGPDQVRATL